MKKIITQVILFLMVVLNFQASYSNDNFSVTGVEVSAEDESGAKFAKEKASKMAQQEAFTRLLKENLKINSDIKPSDEELASMIMEISANNEKISNNRYQAVFDFTFNNEFVSSYLKEKGFYVESKKNDITTILILDSENKTNFENLLKQKLTEKGQNDYVFVRDDGKRQVLKNKDDLAKGEFTTELKQKLINISAKYGANEGVLVFLQQAEQLDVKVAFYNDSNFKQEAKVFENEPNIDEVVSYVTEQIANKPVALYAKKASGAVFTISAKAPISSMQDWSKIQQKLRNAFFVKLVKIDQMSVNEVKVDIKVQAIRSELKSLMLSEGLLLEEDEQGDGYYLSLSSGFNDSWFSEY